MGDANESHGGWSRWEELVLSHMEEQREHNDQMQEKLHSIDTRLSIMESRASQSGGISGGAAGFVVSIIVGVIAYFTSGGDK